MRAAGGRLLRRFPASSWVLSCHWRFRRAQTASLFRRRVRSRLHRAVDSVHRARVTARSRGVHGPVFRSRHGRRGWPRGWSRWSRSRRPKCPPPPRGLGRQLRSDQPTEGETNTKATHGYDPGVTAQSSPSSLSHRPIVSRPSGFGERAIDPACRYWVQSPLRGRRFCSFERSSRMTSSPCG